jgi:hypothetical protein
MPRTKKPKVESISEKPVVSEHSSGPKDIVVDNNSFEKQPKSKKEKVPTTKPKAHGKLVKGSDESKARMKHLREIKAQKKAQKN